MQRVCAGIGNERMEGARVNEHQGSPVFLLSSIKSTLTLLCLTSSFLYQAKIASQNDLIYRNPLTEDETKILIKTGFMLYKQAGHFYKIKSTYMKKQNISNTWLHPRPEQKFIYDPLLKKS